MPVPDRIRPELAVGIMKTVVGMLRPIARGTFQTVLKDTQDHNV